MSIYPAALIKDLSSDNTLANALFISASLASSIQAVAYGGATGGVFSILQSFGATAVLNPILMLGGLLVMAAGLAL